MVGAGAAPGIVVLQAAADAVRMLEIIMNFVELAELCPMKSDRLLREDLPSQIVQKLSRFAAVYPAVARNADLSPRDCLTSKYLLSFSGAIVASAGNFTGQILPKLERDVHCLP